MKNTAILMTLSLFSLTAWGQFNRSETGISAQIYSKELTEFMVKEFIINEIIDIPEKKVLDFDILTLTASKSGELTTVIYECKALNKKGCILAFWDQYINDFSLRYKGYAFRNFDFSEAKLLLDSLESVLEQKKNIINYNNDELTKNAVFKWNDVTFVFYKNEVAANLISVRKKTHLFSKISYI